MGGGYPFHILQAKEYAGDTCQVSAIISSYQISHAPER